MIWGDLLTEIEYLLFLVILLIMILAPQCVSAVAQSGLPLVFIVL